MPEGNEVHRYARLHAATYVGKTICVESPNGRFPGAALLTGRKLKSVIAHGKHLATTSAAIASCTSTSAASATSPKARCPFPK